MKFKKFLSAMFVILVTLMTIAGASAKEVAQDDFTNLNVEFDWVKVNGDELTKTDNKIDNIDRNDEIEVKIQFSAFEDLEDVSVEAAIYGYDQNDQMYDMDQESVGNMDYQPLIMDNDVVVKEEMADVEKVTLNLNLPYNIDESEYLLWVRIHTKDGMAFTTYSLKIEAEEHNFMIKDVVFSPSNTVVAGRSLLSTVYMKNIGNDDEKEAIKVSLNIPALGISAVDYLDSLEQDESTSSEELWVVVPKCTAAGTYDAVITVEFKDGDKTVSTTETINVLENENDACGIVDEPEKTVIAVAGEVQDVTQGEGVALYPLTLTNAGKETKTYVVEVDGYQDWAKVSVSPSNVVVVEPNEAKAVYAYVTALDTAVAGEHMFSVTVKSGSETLKEIPLKANVVESVNEESTSKWGSVKTALEYGLIILIILLVILGLVIGFNKLKGDDEDDFDDEDDKNYY
jgi:hypothetical protein